MLIALEMVSLNYSKVPESFRIDLEILKIRLFAFHFWFVVVWLEFERNELCLHLFFHTFILSFFSKLLKCVFSLNKNEYLKWNDYCRTNIRLKFAFEFCLHHMIPFAARDFHLKIFRKMNEINVQRTNDLLKLKYILRLLQEFKFFFFLFVLLRNLSICNKASSLFLFFVYFNWVTIQKLIQLSLRSLKIVFHFDPFSESNKIIHHICCLNFFDIWKKKKRKKNIFPIVRKKKKVKKNHFI